MFSQPVRPFTFYHHANRSGSGQHQQEYRQPQRDGSVRNSNVNPGIQRTATERHPQSRPLPGPPPGAEANISFLNDDDENDLYDDEAEAQEDLYVQVENTLRDSFGGAARQRPHQSHFRSYAEQYSNTDDAGATVSPGVDPYAGVSPIAQRNGFPSVSGSVLAPRFEEYSDESDAEAAAGFRAMAIAAQAADNHGQSGGRRTPASDLQGSDVDDFGGSKCQRLR